MGETLESWLQAALDQAAGDPLMTAVLLAFATFLTEDGALITGSLLVGSGILDPALAIVALAGGILTGDLGLYGVGWSAREIPYLMRYIPLRRAARIKKWATERQTSLLFLTRFLPGTRFITYVSFGFLRLSILHFAIVLAVSGLLWVSSMVLFISQVQAATQILGPWGAVCVTAGAAFLLVFALPRLMGRGRLARQILEIRRGE